MHVSLKMVANELKMIDYLQVSVRPRSLGNRTRNHLGLDFGVFHYRESWGVNSIPLARRASARFLLFLWLLRIR